MKEPLRESEGHGSLFIQHFLLSVFTSVIKTCEVLAIMSSLNQIW